MAGCKCKKLQENNKNSIEKFSDISNFLSKYLIIIIIIIIIISIIIINIKISKL